MVVVSDTTTITNLIHIGKLYLLNEIFQDIIIPEAVYLEISAVSDQKHIIDVAQWIKVENAENEELLNALLKILDAGEAEAISIALEREADVLIIDEQLGRSIAKKHKIRIIGLIGILIEAKNRMLIDRLKPLLDELIYEFGFRVSPKLYQQVIKMAQEH